MKNYNMMKNIFISCLTFLLITPMFAQCTANFDFGDEVSGISPNPTLDESFAPGIVNEPYEDILHFLVPQYVLDIDSTLPFSPTTPLDSIQLISFIMVDLNDTLTSYTFEELGLSIACNNDGNSGNSCSFNGGSQYCVDIYGTPTMSGNFRADLTIKGYVTIFGFAYGEEQLFGSLNIDLGVEGCMDESALNFSPEAVIDDGSCLLDNACGFNGTEVAAISYSYTNTNTTVEVGELVYWVNYGGFHDVNGDVDSQTGESFNNPEAFYIPSISGNPDGVCMGSHTFSIAGIYTYDCSIGNHAASGMVATVTVGLGGCMDISASNYEAEADFDDGSCETSETCLGDINSDNSVTVSDLLLILSEFGCESNCTTDLNDDGVTTVADLLILLSVFGSAC